jgi:circadian clock protein KaiC
MSPTQHGSNRPAKTPTGVHGLDTITGGGIPRGRPTLLYGGPGCGKTVLGMQTLVNGATLYGEPGLFVSFEEPAEAIVENTEPFGWPIRQLQEQGSLLLDHIDLNTASFEEAGGYELDPIVLRIESAIDEIGAQRVVLDTLEKLYLGLAQTASVRTGVDMLLSRLREKRVTVIFTAEARQVGGTRWGFEDYLSDCAIFLDHRLHEEVSTRRLRVVKYRGGSHETNEYPYLIDEHGISVFPLTSLSLNYTASTERLSTGITALDDMLDGGVYQGSSVLLSGVPGSGKTSISAQCAANACADRRRVLYISFEEPRGDLVRNMGAIGLDLQQHMESGLLRLHSSRPTEHSIEKHLMIIYRLVESQQPELVVFDPMSSIHHAGTGPQARSFMMRLIDHLRAQGCTTLFTHLIRHDRAADATTEEVSSLMDVWIVVRDIRENIRSRSLYIVKARGIAHSNDVRELHFSSRGVSLGEVKGSG